MFGERRDTPFFLEQLVKTAIDDGVSHVATLHVDSFPIRNGWAEELAGRLSGSCVIATLNRVDTGCLLFRREFYLNHHPRFLVTEAERASSRFKEYLRQFDPAVHAGIGYGYKAYCEGLEWYYLKETHHGGNTVHGAIFDDMIFHLVDANRIAAPSGAPTPLSGKSGAALSFLIRWVKWTMKPLVPQRLWTRITTPINQTWFWNQMMLHSRNQLFDDPDGYLEYLRTGKR